MYNISNAEKITDLLGIVTVAQFTNYQRIRINTGTLVSYVKTYTHYSSNWWQI